MQSTAQSRTVAPKMQVDQLSTPQLKSPQTAAEEQKQELHLHSLTWKNLKNLEQGDRLMHKDIQVFLPHN